MLDSVECDQPGGGVFPGGLGGGCFGVIELLLGDGSGVNCICKLESHL